MQFSTHACRKSYHSKTDKLMILKLQNQEFVENSVKLSKKILPNLKPPIGCNNHNHECTCTYHQYSITPRLGLID